MRQPIAGVIPPCFLADLTEPTNRERELFFISVFSMSYVKNGDNFILIIDLIDYTIVTNSEPVGHLGIGHFAGI